MLEDTDRMSDCQDIGIRHKPGGSNETSQTLITTVDLALHLKKKKLCRWTTLCSAKGISNTN